MSTAYYSLRQTPQIKDRSFIKIAIALVSSLVLALSVIVGSVFADTITYTGQGTTNGFCNVMYNVNSLGVDDPIPPVTVNPGQQLWQFNLTQEQGGFANDQLTATFNDGTNYGPHTPDDINGSMARWYVPTSFTAIPGTQVLTGSADDGTTEKPASQLTVSHCWYNPPVVIQNYWCSPGFWAQNQGRLAGSDYDISSLLSTPYSTIGGAPISKKALNKNPTIGQVLASPQTYGGPAFNSVADWLAQHFGWTGTQTTGENCPINAFGVLQV